MKICLLIHHLYPQGLTENAALLGNAMREAGHEVALGFIDTLGLSEHRVSADMAPVKEALTVGAAVSKAANRKSLDDFDVVWVTSFGSRAGFLDKWQILSLACLHTRVINHPDTFMHLHSKYALSWLAEIAQSPPTLATNDAVALWRAYSQGGDWIVKPPGESQGRGVFLLKAGDVNARSLFEHLTHGGRYVLLQHYVQDVSTQGEKRVLLAGGEIVGHYMRKPSIDHRTNLHVGGEPEACELTAKEAALCQKLAVGLQMRGVSFAGVDLVFPQVLEVNVVNPGGIGTIQRLTGSNIAGKIVARALAE